MTPNLRTQYEQDLRDGTPDGAAMAKRYVWWTECGNIAALLRWLKESEDGIDLDNAIYLVSKPWKYDDEWKRMQAERSVTP